MLFNVDNSEIVSELGLAQKLSFGNPHHSTARAPPMIGKAKSGTDFAIGIKPL